MCSLPAGGSGRSGSDRKCRETREVTLNVAQKSWFRVKWCIFSVTLFLQPPRASVGSVLSVRVRPPLQPVLGRPVPRCGRLASCARALALGPQARLLCSFTEVSDSCDVEIRLRFMSGDWNRRGEPLRKLGRLCGRCQVSGFARTSGPTPAGANRFERSFNLHCAHAGPHAWARRVSQGIAMTGPTQDAPGELR